MMLKDILAIISLVCFVSFCSLTLQNDIPVDSPSQDLKFLP